MRQHYNSLKIYFACWFLKRKYILRTPKKVFHEYFHYACYLKANGEATKSGKMEKQTFHNFNGFTIFKVMYLEDIFCLLVSQEKIYVEDPKKGIS